jgi:cyclopropane-fatty-acyl-phospholipid synthase
MMYSCALWSNEEGGPAGDLVSRPGDHSRELEVAQMRKIRHTLRLARVKPGDRLLEFGSGWGAMAIVVSIDMKSRFHFKFYSMVLTKIS